MNTKNNFQTIQSQFLEAMGTLPNLTNPQSFNEKIQWLKLYYRDPLIVQCSDKVTVREYIAKSVGEKYLVPLLGVYDQPEDIPFDTLPDSFILKTNWGSGQTVICHDKSQLNQDEVREQFREWMKEENNHYYHSLEWCYEGLTPKIVCEELLTQAGQPDMTDYKIFCFNGKPVMLSVISDRFSGSLKIDYYDFDWNLLPFTRKYPNTPHGHPMPSKLKEMVRLAKKLSKPFPLVRVDFYQSYDKVYVGELTFFPNNGMAPFSPVEWDFTLGKMLKLPITPRKPKTGSKPLRVAFVTTEYLSEPYFAGGLANYLHRVSTGLGKFGHDVEIFVCSDRDETILHSGVVVHRVKVPPSISVPNDVRCWIEMSERLNTRLKQRHSAHPFDIAQYTNWKGTALRRLADLPAVTRISSYQPLWDPLHTLSSRIAIPRTAEERGELLALKLSDGVYSPSKVLANLIETELHQPVPVLETPFSLQDSIANTEVFDNHFQGKKYLLYFGRVSVNKGCLEIAEIIHPLFKKNPKLSFALVGEDCPHERTTIMKIIRQNAGEYADRLILHPEIPHDKLYPIIENALAVVLPSRIDNLPNTCLEAMGHSKVVIGSSGASFDQVITSGENGLLFDGSATNLLEVIQSAIDLTKKERLLMGEKAKKTIERLHPNIAIPTLIRYYKKAIAVHNENMKMLKAREDELELLSAIHPISESHDAIHLTNTLHTILASRSWRISKPLRDIGNLVRSIKRMIEARQQ